MSTKENIEAHRILLPEGSHCSQANWPNQWEHYDNEQLVCSVVPYRGYHEQTPPTMRTNVRIASDNGSVECSLRTLKNIVAWAEKKEFNLD